MGRAELMGLTQRKRMAGRTSMSVHHPVLRFGPCLPSNSDIRPSLLFSLFQFLIKQARVSVILSTFFFSIDTVYLPFRPFSELTSHFLLISGSRDPTLAQTSDRSLACNFFSFLPPLYA